jgi:DHA1 family tetracycline resistance protein-like MFS transporter
MMAPAGGAVDERGKKRAIQIVLATIFLDTIGVGIIIPVMPALLMELGGQGLGEAASFGGYLTALYALMLFLCAPIMGSLSDRFGRRPVLLLSLTAYALDHLIMATAETLAVLFIGRAIAGITGASHSAANAYMADVSMPAERARNFGRVSAAWGLGFILGPALGGILGELGPRIPFFVSAGLCFGTAAVGFFALPETLSAENRRNFSLVRANPVGAVIQMRRFPVVIGIFVALVFHQIAHDANPSTWSYYTMFKFGWSELGVGLSTAFVGVCISVVQATGVQPAIRQLGERRAVVVGFLLMALGFAGYAAASQGWMMYAFTVLFALGGIAMPALRGILANQVPDAQQGELQGAISSLMGLTMIATPLIMPQIFRTFSADDAPIFFPGAAFATAAVMLLLCVATFMRAIRRAERA